ncbi:MAG: class I SAM-dependent methyltransferase [Anaerolineales bacterium]
MNLTDIVNRNMELEPWAEGEKIPWNDPEFSKRMLKEHLTQQHDAASRRTVTIRKHVQWIHNHLLGGQPSRILDLGCGPGLYASRLAKLGHTCTGIDFSPASIEYATAHAPEGCAYHLHDIRTADYGEGYDLVMLIFGEFDVFRAPDAESILKKSYNALKPGGQLLLEVSTVESVDQRGNQPSVWYSAKSGLFHPTPHLCLMESFWDEDSATATERFLIVDAATARVTRYAYSTRAYTDEQYQTMLTQIGFQHVSFYPSLTGEATTRPDEMYVVLAQK